MDNNQSWNNRPPGPDLSNQANSGFQPYQNPNMLVDNSASLKSGPASMNGPMANQPRANFYQPPSSVNGVSQGPQGPGHVNGQFTSGNLSQGPNMMATNGPTAGLPNMGSQPMPGQFQPTNPTIAGTRPPHVGMPPSSMPGRFPTPPRMPTAPGVTVRPPSNTMIHSDASQGFNRPPLSQNPSLQHTDRPGELPVPFHGQGQYSHQVGMSLTPGITPVNSAPASQKSSRTNSPAVVNQNFDALEGQFRGMPEQDSQTPSTQSAQVPSSQPVPMGTPLSSGQQPYTPAVGPQPGMPPTSIQQLGGQGQLPSNQGPGYGMPGGQMPRPGFPPSMPVNQRPGFQPPTSQPPQPPMGMRPGQLPVSSAANQPRFPPPSLGMQPRGPPPMTGVNQPLQTSNANQVFPPPVSVNNQGLSFPPTSNTSQMSRLPPPPGSSASQMPGFPPPPNSLAGQVPSFCPPNSSSGQVPGFIPPNSSAGQVPGFPPPPNSSANQVQGFPPLPKSSASQVPGFPPPIKSSANQVPGYPTAPNSSGSQVPGFPPPNSTSNNMPGFPPQPSQRFPPPPHAPTSGQHGAQGQTIKDFVNTYPNHSSQLNAMTSNLSNMSMQGSQSMNLLQQKNLIPADGVSTPKPVIPNDNRNVNCSPEVFRCTMNCIPQTSALLNKSRLPLGILIHPFRDLSQLPVIQSSVIVRCRSCRTYINPFVYFVDSRRWKCNLCYRVNELPEEFSYDPVSKTYGDPQRRPEVRSATIEFIAPSEYMLRPPQPAVYLYLLDVSFNAVETGYLSVFCETLLDVLDRIPGDSRTQIGFIAYDSAVHFFNLAEGLSQPQMLTVTDVDDMFLPCPDDLLVNLQECKSLVTDLLARLPTLFENNVETRSALGAALQAAYKMTTATGGRVTVMQTVLPTHGPGALHNREDSTQKTSKDVSSLGPATDFYKKLALDCSAVQIAVDLFMFNGQYADLASIECISKFSGGCVSYYPSYHAARSPHLVEKFEADLRRYLTRKIGFESVMRIRCSKGISIHTFHGNFFVRSTDLLSLPNVNPDAGYGMQMSIEEPLTDMSTMCFQAALLYTSSKGERRIRVHTLCLPVTNQLSDIHSGADQQAIIALLAKMAVDRCISSSMSDAREAIVNAAIDILNSYGNTLPSGQRTGSLCINDQLKLVPLYCLALLKSTAFRTGVNTRLDDRSYTMHLCKTLPVSQLIQLLHPDLYPLHTIMDVEMVKKGQLEFPKLPLLQLSSSNVDRNGAYLLDTGDNMYIYVGSAVNEKFVQDVLDKPNFHSITEGGMSDLPELENEGSERLRSFITYLLDSRPCGSAITIVREDGRLRMKFFQHFVEDRTESSISYIEFLQQVQSQIKS